MAKFFIDRPIFAWVIALFILVVGSVAITQLPIAQYPPVAPPSIVVSANYPGASASTLEDSVLSVIEREMNGTPGLLYMESVAQANGTGNITLSFQPGTNCRSGAGRCAEPVVARGTTLAAGRDAAGCSRG
jgi:multidrug efflux pump